MSRPVVGVVVPLAGIDFQALAQRSMARRAEKAYAIEVAPAKPITPPAPRETSRIVWCPNCKHGVSVPIGQWERCPSCSTEHFVDA